MASMMPALAEDGNEAASAGVLDSGISGTADVETFPLLELYARLAVYAGRTDLVHPSSKLSQTLVAVLRDLDQSATASVVSAEAALLASSPGEEEDEALKARAQRRLYRVALAQRIRRALGTESLEVSDGVVPPLAVLGPEIISGARARSPNSSCSSEDEEGGPDAVVVDVGGSRAAPAADQSEPFHSRALSRRNLAAAADDSESTSSAPRSARVVAALQRALRPAPPPSCLRAASQTVINALRCLVRPCTRCCCRRPTGGRPKSLVSPS